MFVDSAWCHGGASQTLETSSADTGCSERDLFVWSPQQTKYCEVKDEVKRFTPPQFPLKNILGLCSHIIVRFLGSEVDALLHFSDVSVSLLSCAQNAVQLLVKQTGRHTFVTFSSIERLMMHGLIVFMLVSDLGGHASRF